MGSHNRHAGSGVGGAGAWTGRGVHSGQTHTRVDQEASVAGKTRLLTLPPPPPPPSSSPRMGRARRLAWEPKHVPSDLHGSQPSSTLEGQVLHHLVQEEHLGPTVAELEDPRQMQLAPETKGGLALWLQRVQELFQTPVLELRLVSPASAPAELEDIPAEASALRQGLELEPHEPSGMGPGATALMVPGLAEPEPCTDSMSPWDIPGVVSALVPGPKLEPHEPSGLGPVTPAGMAPGLAEPEVDPEPTSPCVAITQDVWRKEEWIILAFPHGLVAEQLTLTCAASTASTLQRPLPWTDCVGDTDANKGSGWSCFGGNCT
nr:histone-lysine N-methyltransferase 2D-like [Manis javanica]